MHAIRTPTLGDTVVSVGGGVKTMGGTEGGVRNDVLRGLGE